MVSGSGRTVQSASSDEVAEIAIVGLSCRLPQAPDPAACWELLSDAVEAITEASEDRWPVDSFHDTDPRAPGKSVTLSIAHREPPAGLYLRTTWPEGSR